MGPDETEVAEDLGVQTERSVDLTCTQDKEMGPESISARHSPLGYAPRKMSPVPRATPQAKQCRLREYPECRNLVYSENIRSVGPP